MKSSRSVCWAAALIAAVVTLTGCVQAAPAGTPTPTVVVTAPAVSMDAVFVAYIRANGSSWFDASDSGAIAEAGRATCDLLIAGGTATQALNIALDAGMPYDDATLFVGASVGAYCPNETIS